MLSYLVQQSSHEKNTEDNFRNQESECGFVRFHDGDDLVNCLHGHDSMTCTSDVCARSADDTVCGVSHLRRVRK